MYLPSFRWIFSSFTAHSSALLITSRTLVPQRLNPSVRPTAEGASASGMDPEGTLDRWLGLTRDVVDAYGERMPEWCLYETLDPRTTFELNHDEQMELFTEAQDYLNVIVSKHGARHGGIDGDVIVEMGFHLSIGLAAAIMAYEYSMAMLPNA